VGRVGLKLKIESGSAQQLFNNFLKVFGEKLHVVSGLCNFNFFIFSKLETTSVSWWRK